MDFKITRKILKVTIVYLIIFLVAYEIIKKKEHKQSENIHTPYNIHLNNEPSNNVYRNNQLSNNIYHNNQLFNSSNPNNEPFRYIYRYHNFAPNETENSYTLAIINPINELSADDYENFIDLYNRFMNTYDLDPNTSYQNNHLRRILKYDRFYYENSINNGGLHININENIDSLDSDQNIETHENLAKCLKGEFFSFEELGVILCQPSEFAKMSVELKIKTYISQLMVDDKIKLEHPNLFISKENITEAEKLLKEIKNKEDLSDLLFKVIINIMVDNIKFTQIKKIYLKLKENQNEFSKYKKIFDAIFWVDDSSKMFDPSIDENKYASFQNWIENVKRRNKNLDVNNKVVDVKHSEIIAFKEAILNLEVELRHIFKNMIYASPSDSTYMDNWISMQGLEFPSIFCDIYNSGVITEDPVFLHKSLTFINKSSYDQLEQKKDPSNRHPIFFDSTSKKNCENFCALRNKFLEKNEIVAHYFELCGLLHYFV